MITNYNKGLLAECKSKKIYLFVVVVKKKRKVLKADNEFCGIYFIRRSAKM